LSVTCFNVELEQFLAWFRIARICQLQLGILVWLNCTKFGQLVLMKIIKIVATNGQILRVKCTKFDFGWGSAVRPRPRRPLMASIHQSRWSVMSTTRSRVSSTVVIKTL